VLDNAEHLLGACAHFVDVVLRRCRNVKLLVTSREAIGVTGEAIYRVPSLTTPDAKTRPEELLSFEAVRLFVARAQAQVTQFSVTQQNASAVASVCRRLDGIPLAIELAAARLRSMTVEEVGRRLDHRFRLLSGGSRTALPRQQTLRSLIDWSYDLLNPAERALFCRSAVFAGGFALEAAARVCGDDGVDEWDVLELLTSLADKSLVATEEQNGTTRYRLLETLREYGSDRLHESGEEERSRDRHIAYFLSLAEEAGPRLRGVDQQAWLDRLEMEHDNLRAALAYACSRRAGAELRLVAKLWQFWLLHGHLAEGRSHLSLALSRAGDQEPSIRARALSGAAILAFEQGDYRAARPLAEHALTIFQETGDQAGRAVSLTVLASVASFSADYEVARTLYEQTLAIRRELDDRRGVASSLSNLALLAADQSDHRLASELYAQSLVIARQLGDKKGIATSLANMGLMLHELGDYASARTHLEQSVVMCRELGDRTVMAAALSALGRLATDEGALSTARALHSESIEVRLELGHRQGIAESLDGFASVALALACPLRAACIWGAAERLRSELGSPMRSGERRRYDDRVRMARAACGNDTAFDAAWREGGAMTLEQAIAFAEQGDAG